MGIKKKIISATIVCALTISLFSGCSLFPEEEAKISDALKIEDISEGIYIMTAEGEFYAPNLEYQNFEGESYSPDSSRVIGDYEDQKFIPTLYSDDKLVYFSYGTIPDIFIIEKFRDTGFTTGLYKLSMGSDGKYSFSQENILGGSFASIIDTVGENFYATLVYVDGKEITPDDLTEAGTIKNLSQDQVQSYGFMIGTRYHEFACYSDMHVYYSSATSSIKKYKTTKNGYVILEFPDDATEGYMSVSGTGMFYKSLDKRPRNEGEVAE